MPNKAKKKTKIVEKDVDYLVEPSASFVSLVPHGANGEPFYVVKSADKEPLVVQRVIVPKTLETKEADELLKSFKTDDEQDFPSYLTYTQVPADQIEEASVKVIKMGDLMAVVGSLKDTDKMQSIAGAEGEVFKELDMETRWDMGDQLYCLETLIMSTASQVNADAKWQKDTIMTALSNFTSFVSAAMEAADVKQLVMPRDRIKEAVREEIKKIDKTTNQEQEDIMGEFAVKTEDEFKALVRKCIEDFVAEKAEADDVQKAKKEKEEEQKKFKDDVNGLMETVKELKKSVEDLANEAPERRTEDSPDVNSTEVKKEVDSDAIFKGAFFAA